MSPANSDPASSLVNGVGIGITLRVVKLLLFGLYINVPIGEFAKIDLRASDFYLRSTRLNRHVGQYKLRETLRGEAISCVHRNPVTMSVDKLLIDPIPIGCRKFCVINLSRRDHHLSGLSRDCVAVDIDIRKVVVSAYRLNLLEGVLQGSPIPQADVFEAVTIVRQIQRFG